ncbi:toxin-antitoxin system YwqK family antitoxin [Paenibacillus sp. GYB004]|uniref:toxin-antitoxin system YwqK family antitoxin n=1 Tax=Paenibacillus sp. GYB004 TaxID=2994393 RepID=UPI002F968262
MILLYFPGFVLSVLLLLVGLVKPSLVLRWGSKRTRGRSSLLYGIAAITFATAMVVVTPDSPSSGQSSATKLAPDEPTKPINEKQPSPPADLPANGKESANPKTVRIELAERHRSQPTFYEGEVNQQGQPHGNGTITYTTTDMNKETRAITEKTHVLYKGQFTNGIYDGIGTLYRDTSGAVEFSGVFRNGEKTLYPFENEFYYDKGKISFYGDPAKTKAGKTMKVFYLGGNLYYSGAWENKQPNGKGTLYYNIFPEQKQAEGTFKNGSLNGKGKMFHENGQVWREGSFSAGQLDGSGKTYHSNGNLESEGTFKEGKLHGKGKTYHENGNLDGDASYEEGKPIGKAKIYHKNGKLAFEGTFDQGMFKPHGIYGNGILYHENGKIMYKGEFKASKYHGKGTLYNDSGDVIQEGQWNEGQFVGG